MKARRGASCRRIVTGRARRRGVASVEAAITLPVLLLMLLGVLHVRRGLGADSDATAEARRCALGYAMNGCTAAPAGCEDVLGIAPGPEDRSVIDAVDEPMPEEMEEAGMDRLETVPVLGDALRALLGDRATAAVTRRYRAHLPGRSEARARVGTYTVLCNVEERAGQDLAKELFDAFL